MVLYRYGTVEDIVLRILRFLCIWCISDREIKSHLQYERWFCNFYWIFVTFLPTLLLIQTALVFDWHGTVHDMVPRILWFLGIWCISGRKIQLYLQYERWFCNFYWIFVTSLPTLLLIQTSLVLDWHGTVDDIVPRILRLLGIECKSAIWTERFLQNERCLCYFNRIFVSFFSLP